MEHKSTKYNSSRKKTDVVFLFRVECDSRLEAEEVADGYKAYANDFARFIRADDMDIMLSKKPRGGQNGRR